MIARQPETYWVLPGWLMPVVLWLYVPVAFCMWLWEQLVKRAGGAR